jgi:hypothetical protein
VGAETKERSYFLKKRSKKLLLLRSHHMTHRPATSRGSKGAKVFWFFFSKKNILSSYG